MVPSALFGPRPSPTNSLCTFQSLLNISTFAQDITLRESELTALRKQIEREYEEKVRIEEGIMEKLRNQMTLDKAAQYSKKVTDKIKKRGTELVGVGKKVSFI